MGAHGDRIALLRAPAYLGSRGEIDVVDLQGNFLVRGLAPAAGHTSRLAWSPDGTRIAYRTRSGRVAVVRASSGSRRELPPALHGRDPAWSPTGNALALATRRGIAVVHPSGRGHRQLTRGRGRDKSPSFSPDGRWIAFARQTGVCDRPGGRCEQDLYRVPRAGGKPTLIRRTPKLIETAPVWSPR